MKLTGGDLLVSRTAVFSEETPPIYRYRLDIESGPGKVAAVCMVNPSTADHVADDNTIRRVRGFARREGVGRLIILNAFAFRSTDIRGLRGVADPVGPENDRHIREAFSEAEIHVVAWGRLAKLPAALRDRWRQVVAIGDEVGCKLRCLGIADDGHPRHPLFVPYAQPLEDWVRPAA